MFNELSSLPSEYHVGLALILGLLVGSFLNVVIYRYPKLLKHQWSAQSHEWLHDKPYTQKTPDGIVSPGSRCGNCETPIKIWHNIPLVSYILLGGKCASCKSKISFRYPLVELLTGVLTSFIVYNFGWSVESAFGVLLTWSLLALSFIDFDHQLLPDDIVLPVLWLGIGISLIPVFANPASSIIGAIAGYLVLWIVFQVFKLLTGKDGMGHGDFKLLALFGAWFGWQCLPQILLISTILGSIAGITLILLKKANKNNAIPFGPYIAIAGWSAMLWGEKINILYLNYSGF